MRICRQYAWFAVFTAVFAVLAAFVFWGTWSMDRAPVMPDSPILYSSTYLADWWRNWREAGKFVPGDLKVFLFSPYFWQELNYVIGAYSAALALAYFLRGRGVCRLAAYGSGLLLGFCGYWFTLFSAGHGSWFTWMTYGLWPFGFFDRAIRRGKLKNWLLGGATLGWAAYWQEDLWLLFTVLTGAYFVYALIRERKLPWKGMLFAAVALFLVGGAAFHNALFSSLAGRDKQIADGHTLSQQSKDSDDKRWIFVTNWSLPPAETAEFVCPRINGDTSCMICLSLGSRYATGITQYTGALGRAKDATSGNYRQHSLYVGAITCLLALFSVVLLFSRRFRRWDVAFFAIAAVLCWLFSMGRYCEVVYRMIYALPFGDYLRAPVKWHHLTEFCLCVLAGFGIDAVVRMLPKKAVFAIVALIAIAGFDLAYHARFYCVPVDISEARRTNRNMDFTFLRQQDFANPQIQAMVKSKAIVSYASPSPGIYLVGVLSPWNRPSGPMPPMGTRAYLSILSMISSLVIVVVSVRGKHVWRA